MRNATILAVSLFVVGLSLRASFAAPPPESGSSVSGAVTVDGEKIPLTHAYLDETDPEEPIVVLSDKPLPPDAIPFLSEKLVRESRLHAVAFSVSRKDGKLTNTYGKLFCPGHELGVGFARVEDGNVLLVTKRIDASGFEGRFMTPKPVKLSFVAYSFDLSFRISGSEPKRSR
jgi:hypothetical protein